MSSSTYKRFSHLQIPLEEIASATSNFSDANFINETPSGKVYKGQLLWSEQLMNVVAERFRHELGDVEFWKEISILSSLKHENLVTIIGFCDEGGEKIMITKLEGKGRLDKFLGDLNLTWMQRLQISVGVAQALNYIYYDEQRDFSVIHRNIMSSKILLDDNWEPKLSGFEASINQTAAQRDSLLVTEFCGTPEYSDPMYLKNGTVRHKSDIYSFGVVLFELLCGKKATMADETNVFSAQLTRFRYEKETVEDMIDPGLRKQMDPESLKIFSEIAYYCLMEQPFQRPTIDRIVVKLQKASEYQRKHENPQNNKDNLQISLADIKLATQNFSDDNIIGGGEFGKVYKGELQGNRCNHIAAKRLYTKPGEGEQQFLLEMQILLEYRHENIAGLVGYCNEMGEKIIVYEHASRGSLDNHLKDNDLTWMKRLQICIDIASGLNFLHGDAVAQKVVIHKNIQSSNIILYDEGKAKITDFGLTYIAPINKYKHSVFSSAIGTIGYADPLYESPFITKECDIFSFGEVLLEILSGCLASKIVKLVKQFRRHHEEGTLDEIVFKGIKEQIKPKSLYKFQMIIHQCLHLETQKRPTASEVLLQLKEALEFQMEKTASNDVGTSKKRVTLP